MRQKLRDETYIKLVEFTTSQFKMPLQSLEDVEAQAKLIVPIAEQFIMKKL